MQARLGVEARSSEVVSYLPNKRNIGYLWLRITIDDGFRISTLIRLIELVCGTV